MAQDRLEMSSDGDGARACFGELGPRASGPDKVTQDVACSSIYLSLVWFFRSGLGKCYYRLLGAKTQGFSLKI